MQDTVSLAYTEVPIGMISEDKITDLSKGLPPVWVKSRGGVVLWKDLWGVHISIIKGVSSCNCQVMLRDPSNGEIQAVLRGDVLRDNTVWTRYHSRTSPAG